MTGRNLKPLDIVGGSFDYGVVLARSNTPYEEYRVQVVNFDHTTGTFYPAYQGLYNADDIVPQGFCENDSAPGLILCAAASIYVHIGDRHAQDHPPEGVAA